MKDINPNDDSMVTLKNFGEPLSGSSKQLLDILSLKLIEKIDYRKKGTANPKVFLRYEEWLKVHDKEVNESNIKNAKKTISEDLDVLFSMDLASTKKGFPRLRVLQSFEILKGRISARFSNTIAIYLQEHGSLWL